MKSIFKQMGAKPTDEDIRRYKHSPHWHDGKFRNFTEVEIVNNFWDMVKILYKQVTVKERRMPDQQLPIQSFDEAEFVWPCSEAKFIWYGHSVLLMNIKGKIILLDPMLGSDASPISPTKTKRFSDNTLELIDQFPEIDLLLLTHDHYDHLDYDSIQKLITKTKNYYVALGCKRHLVEWGVADEKVREFDWWQQEEFHNIQFTFTPSRHFSGRGLTDRFKCLWGGWVIDSGNQKIWFSGDGGYGDHFSEIGKRHGPFDFAFMECGQYNEQWGDLHLFPSDCIKAAQEALVRKVMPVHWAGFALAQHTWIEPAEEFLKYANANQLDVSFPDLGRIFKVSDQLADNYWWRKYAD